VLDSPPPHQTYDYISCRPCQPLGSWRTCKDFHARLRFRKNSLFAANVIIDDILEEGYGRVTVECAVRGLARGVLSSHEVGRDWWSRNHVLHVMLVFIPRVLDALIGIKRYQRHQRSCICQGVPSFILPLIL
jgi:hypothetical protein